MIKECISPRYGRAGMGVPRCKKKATRNLFGPRCEKCYIRMVESAKEDSVIRRVFSIRPSRFGKPFSQKVVIT